MAPPIAVHDLERPHRQPVTLLEPVGVRERAGRGDLVEEPRLHPAVHADLRERALGRLIGVTGEQVECRRQLLGDVVQDQMVVVRLPLAAGRGLVMVHRRQR